MPPDPHLIALGIQQPWAELILRGVKTIEVRSQPTQVRGTIYLYASKRTSPLPDAAAMVTREQLELEALPKGLLVGTVEVVGCRPCVSVDSLAACVSAELLQGRFAWQFAHPRRLPKPLAVRFLPYGVWFYPFKRKHEST